MERFWSSLIKPIFEIIKPKSVIEIGPGDGLTTAHLVEYCLREGSKVHVIDSDPAFNVIDLKTRHADACILHQESSLDALPKIASCDAAIINGDHNWYTVFNELILIEKISEQKQFPVVFVHHTGWPYGRRDSYRDPQSIPILYRKPNKKAGLSPDQNKLVGEGGLNNHLYNSIYENTPQNGALTAVEDFLQSTAHDIRLILVPGLFGLALLLPQSLLKEKPTLAASADSLEMNAVVLDHLQAIEKERITGLLMQERLEETCRRKDIELQYKAKLIRKAERDIGKLEARIDLMESSFGWKVLCCLKKNRMLLFLYFLFKKNSSFRGLFFAPGRLLEKIRSRSRIHRVQGILDSEASGDSASFSRRITHDNTGKNDNSADVILYSNGDLPALKNTLVSLSSCTDCSKHRIYLIDDSGTASFAEEIGVLASGIDNLTIFRNEQAQGYLRSVSEVLRNCAARHICVATTNVVFTPEWLDNLIACSDRISAAGFISPLSTSSLYYKFKLNSGDTINSAAEKIRKLSTPNYPATPLPEPHIFLMKRKLLTQVSFPSDSPGALSGLYRFFLKAYRNQYLSVIADNVLVSVSSAQSIFPAGKHPLVLEGFEESYREILKEAECRRACNIGILKKYQDSDMRLVNPRMLVAVFPGSDEGGAASALANIANGLILKGVEVKCIIPPTKAYALDPMDLLFEPVAESCLQAGESNLDDLPENCLALASSLTFSSAVEHLKQLKPSVKIIPSNHETADSLSEALEIFFNEAQEHSKRKCADRTCNIIVPIHNELDSVKRCLQSIEQYTDHPYRVYLIDDCSDKHTKDYLRNFVRDHDHFRLIENDTNLGYGASCNAGMAATESGDLLLLNSDVIVTPGWLRKIVACAYSDGTIGVVTPLSNRSPHCWIHMNPGDNIFTAAAKIEKLSQKKYPDVVTTEGWCFFIKRIVYEHIGPFDPIFGKGYCEDSDFSMRTLCNGYRTVCADDTFIFHKGSASFKKERTDRYTHNRRIFDQRWGPYYLKLYEKFKEKDPLQYIRGKYKATATRHYLPIAEALTIPHNEVFSIMKDETLQDSVDKYLKNAVSPAHENQETNPSDRVVFLLPFLIAGGGILSVTQLVNDLILSGVDAKVVVLEAAPGYEDILLYTTPIAYEDFKSLINHFPGTKYIVATFWITMYYLVKIVEKHTHLIPCYFIQDFEPYFYEEHHTEMRQLALDTYRIPAKRFAKTHWIINKVAELGYHVHKVPPGLDLDIFYPRDRRANDGEREKIKIVVMMRPSSKRRGFSFLSEVLQQVKREFSHVEIHAFGATEEELEEYSIPFDFVNHEILSSWQLADLYSSADLYIDFSDFHGFGRTAVEAMACGACVVITDSGGVDEYAVNEYNCLLSAPGNLPAMLSNIRRLIRDRSLRNTLAANGLESVKRFERAFSSRETWRYIREGAFPPQDSEPVQKQAGAPFVPRTMKHTVVLIRAGDYRGRFPHALLSLAAGLDQGVVLLDNATPGMILEHKDAVNNAICVGFSTITGPQIKCSLETARAVRALKPEVPLVWGGWHPSLLPQQTLENRLVDKVVVGRGGKVLHDIIMNIKEGRAFDDILTGEEKDNGWFPLDLLSRLGDMEKYIVPGLTPRTISLYASPSCPSWAGTGGDSECMKKARRPGHNIVEFIEYMIKKFGIDGVHFNDEDFFAEEGAALDFSENLLKADVTICWSAGADVENLCSLAPNEWEMLKRSGCRRLLLHAESGARLTLQKLNWRITPELIREAAGLCGRHGIIPGFSMLVGFPGETYAEMEETFHLASAIKKEVPASEPVVFLYAPCPGAPLYELACEMGFSEPDSFEGWGNYNFDITATPWLDEALLEYIRELNLVFSQQGVFEGVKSR